MSRSLVQPVLLSKDEDESMESPENVVNEEDFCRIAVPIKSVEMRCCKSSNGRNRSRFWSRSYRFDVSLRFPFVEYAHPHCLVSGA